MTPLSMELATIQNTCCGEIPVSHLSASPTTSMRVKPMPPCWLGRSWRTAVVSSRMPKPAAARPAWDTRRPVVSASAECHLRCELSRTFTAPKKKAAASVAISPEPNEGKMLCKLSTAVVSGSSAYVQAPRARTEVSQVTPSTARSFSVAPNKKAISGVKMLRNVSSTAPVSAGIDFRPRVLKYEPTKPIAPNSPAARYTLPGTRRLNCSPHDTPDESSIGCFSTSSGLSEALSVVDAA
mmetsp:Transcript_62/g.126  ORF Transcript_62/g.126 Transcript_62/m.126 type:complete len:239 (-) Transcript_62:8-724(-)